MSDLLFGLIGLALTVFGLALSYTGWRSKQLRKDEILAWSWECIEVLQTTSLTISAAVQGRRPDDFAKVMSDLGVRSSVQAERGRLFFRNEATEQGSDKALAYRGLRLKILDCLVANFQICTIAAGCGEQELLRLAVLSKKYEQEFVSFAQTEVGRSRMPRTPASEPGKPVNISSEMALVADDQLAAAARRFQL